MPEFKLFTLGEAERTLPLVRRIVQDLTTEYPAWRAAVSRFEILTGGARADWGETAELVGFSVWLLIMQGAGVLGALIVLLIGLPTAAKLSRLDPMGAGAAYFDELRQRQRVVGSVSGTLALLALVAGALVR